MKQYIKSIKNLLKGICFIGSILFIFSLFLTPIFLGATTNNYYDSYDNQNQGNKSKYICNFTPGTYMTEDGNYVMTISEHIPWGYSGANNRHEHRITIEAYYNYAKPIESDIRFIHPDEKSTFESSNDVYFIVMDDYIRVVDEYGWRHDIRLDGNYYLDDYELSYD